MLQKGEHMAKGKRHKSYGGRVRVHESREDRVRTNAGKTKVSKVRSQGRTARALAKSAKAKTVYGARR